MALIAMAIYDTVENQRSKYTISTLNNLFYTVDFSKHRLMLIDNNSCELTKNFLKQFKEEFTNKNNIEIITCNTNIGTAEAINLGWKQRVTGENCVKMDNDVIIHKKGWIDELEAAIQRDNTIGQAGLKRKDCCETPNFPDLFYRSELTMLPHKPGEKWIIVEKVNHVMGTCVMHSSALLDKVGYLYQPKLYGFDDSFMSLRSTLAGFKNIFLSHIEIDHIDPGDNPYQKWKENHASECWNEYQKAVKAYKSGTKSLYYNPFI